MQGEEQEGFGADVPRRKRGRPSRLSRASGDPSKLGDQPKGKSGVDRFHYLFEAIEADKASDSETANEGTSSSPRAGQNSDAQATSPPPLQASAAGAKQKQQLELDARAKQGCCAA